MSNLPTFMFSGISHSDNAMSSPVAGTKTIARLPTLGWRSCRNGRSSMPTHPTGLNG